MPDEMRPGSPAPSAGSGQPPTAAVPRPLTWRRFLLRWAKRLGITFLFFLLLSALSLGVAEHETSKPGFCGSCHIMESYYNSWHADLHGDKLDVACVDCHYAPGESSTVGAKLRGLSQVASYVSGRYGKSRPRAHVDNRSCLTSKCHGDLSFMDKEISLGTVKFFHAKHLQPDEAKQAAMAQELKKITEALRERFSQERLEKLTEVACLAEPAKERNDRMLTLASEWGVKVEPQQLATFSELHQQQVRVSQLGNLQCINCHSYAAADPSFPSGGQAHHFTVKSTSCYTCHFTNESFNVGTARCLLCHTLPTKEILVHPEMKPGEEAKLQTPQLAKQSVQMDHQAMLKRNVSCLACHADVATENSTVTRRDCEHCHDRPEFFQEWKTPLSLDMVEKYHAAHVPGQQAKCLDCHSVIHHQLAPARPRSTSPIFCPR